jgi:hypothetical protein
VLCYNSILEPWMCLMFDVMLFWPSVLVQAALAFVAVLGALQAAALRNGLDGLAWPVGLAHRRSGYFVAVLLMMEAFIGEAVLVLLDVDLAPWWWVLTLLAGGGVALVVSVVGAALRLRWNKIRRRRPSHWGNPVELGPLRATFHRPAGSGPFPALCLLPDPTAPGDDLTPLVRALIEAGIAVLALDWRSLDRPDRLTMQGLASVGVSRLAGRAEIEAERVGIIGVGLGGDLALCGAARDSSVAAVLAIEPVFSGRRPMLGIEALCSLSWFEAQLRVQRWRRSPLVEALDASSAVPRVAPRPAAIVVGSADGPNSIGILEILQVAGGCPLTPAAHEEAVQRAAQWLAEHLA